MRALSHFSQRFRSLQWNLTLYYILTTIVVMLILEMIVVLGYYGFFSYNTNRMLATQVGSVAQNAAANFSGPFINRDQLYEALKDWPLEVGTEFQGYSAAVDPEGFSAEHYLEPRASKKGRPSSRNFYLRDGPLIHFIS